MRSSRNAMSLHLKPMEGGTFRAYSTKTGCIVLLLFIVSLNCIARAQASTLDAQIEAVKVEQDRERAAEKTRLAELHQVEDMRRADQRRQEEVAARAQKRHDQAIATQQAKAREERQREAAHKQAYEDQRREIQLERERTELAVMKARAARSNEYIDRELRGYDAQTDAIKSEADATRNLSEGGKSLLQDAGKAQLQKASGWFH